MELDDAIQGRRSIRQYTRKEVPEKFIRQVIEAATFAPSAKNGQQWRFTVLTGPAKNRLTSCFRYELERLCERGEDTGSALGSCQIMEEAPVVIVLWNAGDMGWETEKHSVAAAIQNLLLKAYSLELGSLWIGDIFYSVEALEHHLDKPWRILAAVTLGYPAYILNGPWNGKPRKSVDEVTEFLR